MKKTRTLKNFISINNMLSMIIPLILVVLLVIPLLFNYMIKDINQKNTMLATTIAQRMTDFIDESFLVLVQLNDLLDNNTFKDEADLNAYLNTILGSSNAIEGFEILDTNGVVKTIAPENANILGANRSSQGFFTITQNNQKPYVSLMFISQLTGQPTITIAIPNGTGVLVAYLNLEKISLISLNLSKAFGDQVTVAITDNKGVFISNKDTQKIYQREIEENFKMVHHDKKIDEHIDIADYEGKTMIVSHADVDQANWHVFVYQAYDSIFSVFRPVLWLFLLSVCLLVIFSRFMARLVFKDINYSISELNQQTREIAEGDYHLIVSVNRFEEYNILTENFNSMIESIQGRDAILKKIAYYDPQTKLPNTAYFSEHLNQCILKNSRKTGVICFDIHNFKRINDTYGTSFGDEILEIMGERLLAMELTNGFVARVNGSNFVRVLTGVEDRNEIISEINNFRFVFNQAMIINENKIYLRFHVGIAIYPDDTEEVERLLQYAHTAADMAKQRGAAVHAFFENSMRQTMLRNMTLENSLRSALKNHEFYLHYQPQIEVKTQKIRGIEALIRWEHPQLGKISPLDFIQIAESTGMIIPIGAWVLESACRQMVQINKEMGTKIMISVNVSPIQLSHERFPEMVEETLKQSGLAPDLLEFEITESLFIHSFEEAVKLLNRLKKIGIRISLDDFGTGYSSLAYLKNLPIDTLKIDQAFTRDLLLKKSNEYLMESIIVMAHLLNMDVIVEGVEEIEQLNRLFTYACDYVQGYYFSRPIEVNQLKVYILAKKDGSDEI